MKLSKRFKAVLLGAGAALYATGVAVLILSSRFEVDRGFGPEPAPARAPLLHAHAVVGLAFLVLFGCLWSEHIEPGLKKRKRRRSGLALLAAFGILFATVPLLYYASGEAARAWTAAVHTWLGAALLAPFLIHASARRR